MTEIIPIALSIIAVIVSALTAFKSVTFVVKREEAEREFIKIVLRSYKRTRDGKVAFSYPTPTPDELEQLEQVLRQSIENLDDQYKHSVIKAISQPSEAGQIAYRKKLIKELTQAAI